MSDVHSGGRVDGDGGVVGRRVEGVRRHGGTYGDPKKNDLEKIFIVAGSRRVGEDGHHVDDVEGHHVKVGVGVLPGREGRRCYSGL